MALGFLGKLFSFLYADKPGRKNRRLLKQLGKDLAGSRLSRFYKPRQAEAQPAMGQFFWDIYKVLSHAQAFLQNAVKSAQLKQLTVEAFLDMRHLDARQRLNAGYVEEKAQTMPLAEVSHLLKEDLAILADAFDGDFVSRVDTCYTRILQIVHLVSFDYFFFLRMFDSGIVERYFAAVPRFRPVQGTLILEVIKDFLEVAYPIEPDLDWTIPLRVLKVYKNGMDVFTADEWTRLLGALRDLRRSSILELMVRHITQDPQWEFKTRITQEHIAAAYLEECRQEVDGAITGFLYSQRQNQVAALAGELFGDPGIQRLLYYTEKESEAFVARGLDGFAHAQCLNYLKAFMADFFLEDLQPLCELLLVQGHWASIEQSRAVSDLFHTLMNNTNRLLTLEQSLSESGEYGADLRIALAKSERNRGQLRHMERILKRVNAEAWDLLSGTGETLFLLGKVFKDILRGPEQEDGALIVNFRELRLKENDPPLVQRIILAYRRIYTYLRIHQLLIGAD
ncbi:MAG: DUF5312 domain-containing protein [Treponema sp.]|jgi:hypothetical protein|nr:DUF5312 domain-containing protein [Treponema sp.]